MSVKKTLVCDLCEGTRPEEENSKSHYTDSFAGPVSLDFTKHRSMQVGHEFETLCTPCANKLNEAIVAVVEKLRPKKNGN